MTPLEDFNDRSRSEFLRRLREDSNWPYVARRKPRHLLRLLWLLPLVLACLFLLYAVLGCREQRASQNVWRMGTTGHQGPVPQRPTRVAEYPESE